MSISQFLGDVANAQDAVENPGVRHALSTGASERLRQFLEANSYAFTYVICGHRDMRPEIHMPVAFAACGQASLLAWSITQSGFEGYLIEQFREACRIRNIDPATPAGVAALDAALDWINFRITRGWFKSSVITHGGATWTGTVDPNSTSKITTAVDVKAWELGKQIGETILSGRFADIFPDRVPLNPQKDVSESSIRFGGRTISHPQQTVNALGYLTKDEGAHYNIFWLDDLVVGGPKGNNTPAAMPGVRTYLSGLTGYFMNTRRIRQVHAGTRPADDDDHQYLTTGRRATSCMSIVVPIETYDEPPASILERGTPTMPTFLPVEKIQALQDRVLTDESEEEGVDSWNRNYLMKPSGAGGRLFPDEIIDDLDRRWMGPYEHPRASRGVRFKRRFLVERFARDKEGRPVDRRGNPLIEAFTDRRGEVRFRIVPNWHERARVLSFDPWRDLDRVLTLDPAWKDGGNNWAITVAGVDHELVKFQLESRDGQDGMEGWIEALPELVELYEPRVIGFGGGGYQDPVVKNIFATDPRLRKLRTRVVSLPEQKDSKKARIRNGVADQMKIYRWLCDPTPLGQPTRDEMRLYKGEANASPGILDSMSMVPALLRLVKSPEKRAAAEVQRLAAHRQYQRSVDPYVGVPLAV